MLLQTPVEGIVSAEGQERQNIHVSFARATCHFLVTNNELSNSMCYSVTEIT